LGKKLIEKSCHGKGGLGERKCQGKRVVKNKVQQKKRRNDTGKEEKLWRVGAGGKRTEKVAD